MSGPKREDVETVDAVRCAASPSGASSSAGAGASRRGGAGYPPQSALVLQFLTKLQLAEARRKA